MMMIMMLVVDEDDDDSDDDDDDDADEDDDGKVQMASRVGIIAQQEAWARVEQACWGLTTHI